MHVPLHAFIWAYVIGAACGERAYMYLHVCLCASKSIFNEYVL